MICQMTHEVSWICLGTVAYIDCLTQDKMPFIRSTYCHHYNETLCYRKKNLLLNSKEMQMVSVGLKEVYPKKTENVIM